MTPLERALSKAYLRRQIEGDEPRQESRLPAGARGWVNQLRAPLEPPDPEAPNPYARIDPQHAGYSARLREPALASAAIAGTTRALPPTADAPGVANTPPESQTSTPTFEQWSWPEICQRLMDSSSGADLRLLAARIGLLASSRGKGSVAFSGPGRRTGRTTLLLTFARILMETTERRILLIEADADLPGLATALGLKGVLLSDDCTNAKPRSDPPLRLLHDRLALWVPKPAGGVLEPSVDEAGTVGVLPNDGFDLALIDTGPSEALKPPSLLAPGGIDAIVSVSRFGPPGDDEATRQLCQRLGARLLGVIETFAPAANVTRPQFLRQTVSG
jgi:hypothetical protein